MLRDQQKRKTGMSRIGSGEKVLQRTENEREREDEGNTWKTWPSPAEEGENSWAVIPAPSFLRVAPQGVWTKMWVEAVRTPQA